MDTGIPRREFLKATAAAAGALAIGGAGQQPAAGLTPASAVKLEPFDYEGVRLRASRWQQQFESGREFSLGVSDEDILHGFRTAARLPAPGRAARRLVRA